jgi:adenylate cyclase class 1
MASAPQAHTTENELDIRGVRKRFLAINRERLRRTQEALRWRTRDFLDLLPLFFHINHAMLPGFVTKQTPAGISAWSPTKKSLDAAKRLAKSFDHKKRALRTYDIHSIFLMGSVGTIAHSEKSDFDIWICHRPDLTVEQKTALRSKCRGIEEWADSVGLEVHFFLMDADKFRQGTVVELSSESSGSTQHHLLLEEFYRTGLLVAGRYPVWWLVPPQQESKYDEIVARLIHQRFIPANEVIDFGGLSEIPAEEFFGAALWQVYKGIDSPYKSVLKMLLMEVYADEYPYSDLLSLRYKRAIYDGVTDLDELDPYTILLEKLEQYLQARNEPERLDLVRRCFYFKVQLPLSKSQQAKDNWRWELMWELTQRWQWSKGQIESLDLRDVWNVHKVLKERKILVDEITHSYMALSKFARSNASLARIEQKDLNILGRKLYAAFERKAGKIETINRGISSNIVEEQITLQQGRGKDDEESWNLYPGAVEPGESVATLKRARSVVEVLAWCYFNQLIGPRTVISLTVSSGILSLKEVRDILGTLQSLFPGGHLPHTSIDDFVHPPRVLTGCLFANVGIDPLPTHSRRGTDLVSNQSDVMNYSGFSLNLALSFDLVAVTSWQEIITYQYKGIEGLLDCFVQCLRWNTSAEAPEPPPLKAFSFSSSHSNAIARRIEQLFHDLALLFYRRSDAGKLCYVLQVEKSFYLLESEQGAFQYSHQPAYDDLLEALSKPQQEFRAIKVDRYALNNSPLPAILQRNRAGFIQVFYLTLGELVDVFVLDEQGALFHQRVPYYDDGALLSQYHRFFDAILSRQSMLHQDDAATLLLDALEIYKVSTPRVGKTVFERQEVPDLRAGGKYFNVQVLGDMVGQKTVFTIYCDEREFSSLDHGNDLFREVAKYVIQKRTSGLRYPIYITDVDLSPGLLGEGFAGGVQVVEYLRYKKRIEAKLNGELARL